MVETRWQRGEARRKVACGDKDTLSKIFAYLDVKDIPSVCLTSRAWRSVLRQNELVECVFDEWEGPIVVGGGEGSIEIGMDGEWHFDEPEDTLIGYSAVAEQIFQSCFHQRYPELERLYHIKVSNPEQEGRMSICWRTRLLFRRVTTEFEPGQLNRELQRDLATMFACDQIVAFTLCCATCTNTYDMSEEWHFRGGRRWGANFFKLDLGGMNYEDSVEEVYVCYHGCLEHLLKGWHQECEYIHEWCAVLGLTRDDYTITKPASEKNAIQVSFKKPYQLEKLRFEDAYEEYDSMHDSLSEEEE